MSERQTVCIQYYNSPCGKLIIGSFGDAICLCDWAGKPSAERNRRRIAKSFNAVFMERTSETLRIAVKELDEYFAGTRESFNIPLRLAGSEFQKKVWKALQEIPYGETRTYLQIAVTVNNPRGIRAVAQAIGANALSIIIPCHRVIGSNGSLTGFAGGFDAKRHLLEIERTPQFRPL